MEEIAKHATRVEHYDVHRRGAMRPGKFFCVSFGYICSTVPPVPMPDYDAIVIGAGHNGLTAAAVMARGGMRVLCLEKNHFIGGMASTTELVRGFRFELAGFHPVPGAQRDLRRPGLRPCPIYEPEVQSASIGEDGRPPLLLYSDPERLLEHLGETLGLEAVLGMAEVAAWAEAPARAIGRFDVRRPPQVTRRDVGLRRQREGAPGHPHRHVRQRHGRGRPLPPRPGRSMRSSAAC